ncbi:MAG: aldo/keto reductase [Eubacteriales bacterium]|nr:aldo/keto reductase [Eubacteriales bacterium]
MRHITLKNTDLNLSNLCFGTAGFGEKLNRDEAFEILDAFVRQGGNFIDTANVYCRWIPGLGNCSEKMLGEWLKSRSAYKEVTIATKGGHYHVDSEEKSSRVNEQDIRLDLEDSLNSLGLEVIDFYWLHRDDATRPIEEIIDILEKLKSEGKIRYYGLSNYSVSRLKEGKKYLESKGLEGPYAVSNQWSLATINPGKNTNPDPTLVEFSEEEFQWHEHTGVPMIPFSSTAMGFFEKLKKAGVKVKNGELISRGDMVEIPHAILEAYLNEKNLHTYEVLLKLQKETGHSLQALSAAYFLSQPFQVIPIGSARNLHQLAGFFEASEIQLPAESFQ